MSDGGAWTRADTKSLAEEVAFEGCLGGEVKLGDEWICVEERVALRITSGSQVCWPVG